MGKKLLSVFLIMCMLFTGVFACTASAEGEGNGIDPSKEVGDSVSASADGNREDAAPTAEAQDMPEAEPDAEEPALPRFLIPDVWSSTTEDMNWEGEEEWMRDAVKVTIPFSETNAAVEFLWEFDGGTDDYYVSTAPVSDPDARTEVSHTPAKRVLLDGREYADDWYVLCVSTGMDDGQNVESRQLFRTEPAAGRGVTITKQPESVVAAPGCDAAASVEATGEGLKYTWYVAKAGKTEYVKSKIKRETYSVPMDPNRNGSKLVCVVTDVNGVSAISQPVVIGMDDSLGIYAQPEDVIALEGEKASVKVKAAGKGLTYQWYYAPAGADEFKASSVQKATYSTEADAKSDGRKLYCVITDENGNSVTTNIVMITAAKSPTITLQPEDARAAKGKRVRVPVEAVGYGLTYQWYFADVGSEEFSESSVRTNVYEVKMTENRDGRRLYCVITDENGVTVTTQIVTIAME